jgi:hypothetical protein
MTDWIIHIEHNKGANDKIHGYFRVTNSADDGAFKSYATALGRAHQTNFEFR